MEIIESVALGLLDLVIATTQTEESEPLTKEEIFKLYDECVGAVKKHKPAFTPRPRFGDSDGEDRPKRAYNPKKYDDDRGSRGGDRDRGGDRGPRQSSSERSDWDERPRSTGGVYSMRDGNGERGGDRGGFKKEGGFRDGGFKKEGGFKKKRFAD